MSRATLYVKDDGIYLIDEDGSDKKISEYASVIKRYKNLEDMRYQYILEFQSLDGEIVQKETLPTDYTSPRQLLQYVDYGLQIVPGYVNFVAQALLEQSKNIAVTTCHTGLGFTQFGSETIFRLYKTYGGAKLSYYVGNKKIKPTGKYERYCQMLKEHVLDYIQLQAILAISLSAVVLGKVADRLNLDSYIVHLVGNSSCGKTTSAKLAISVFASPNVKDDSLITTYNATGNALRKNLAGLYGLPYAFDEISTSTIRDFTKLIYDFCNGTEKKRLNSEAQMMPDESWQSVIISTGERSILKAANKNLGIHVRVFEFHLEKWTASASTSETISEVIARNYALLGWRFVKIIMGIDNITILKIIKQYRKEILTLIKEGDIFDDFSNRRCKFYAIILAAAHMAKEHLGLGFSMQELEHFFVQQEVEAFKKRQVKRTFLSFLESFIEVNQNRFIYKSYVPSGKCLGEIRVMSNGEQTEVLIYRNAFAEITKEYGMEEPDILIHELKKTGVLNHDSDRNTRTRKIHGRKTDVYVIRLDKEKGKEN